MTAIQKMVALLKSYPVKMRQIEQLRYEKDHPPQISDHGMIEDMARCVPGPSAAGKATISPTEPWRSQCSIR